AARIVTLGLGLRALHLTITPKVWSPRVKPEGDARWGGLTMRFREAGGTGRWVRITPVSQPRVKSLSAIVVGFSIRFAIHAHHPSKTPVHLAPAGDDGRLARLSGLSRLLGHWRAVRH